MKNAKVGPPGYEISFQVASCTSCPFGPIVEGQDYCLKEDMRPLTPEDMDPYPS